MALWNTISTFFWRGLRWRQAQSVSQKLRRRSHQKSSKPRGTFL